MRISDLIIKLESLVPVTLEVLVGGTWLQFCGSISELKSKLKIYEDYEVIKVELADDHLLIRAY